MIRTELSQKVDAALERTIVGDVLFTEDELEELRSDIQDKYDEKLRYAMNPLEMLKINEKVLVVLFVNYARDWESSSEKNFWTSLFDKVLDDPDFSQTKLYGCFEDVFQRYGVFRTPGGKRSFYSTFLFHALAPKSSFEAFTRMLWQEFFLDPELMNGSYDPFDPLIPEMVSWLKQHFAAQSDNLEHDLQISTSSYAIRSGMKYAFMQYPKAEMTKLLHQMLRLMDAWYCNDIVNLSEQGGVAQQILESLRKITRLDMNLRHRTRGTSSPRALPELFRVNPSYSIDAERGPMIVFPEARVFAEQINRIQITLFLDNVCLTTLNRFVIGHDIRRRLEKIEIPLLTLLRGQESRPGRPLFLRFEMTCGDEKIIDTEEKLYRSYLLLDENGEVQRMMPNYDKTYMLLALDSDVFKSITDIERGYAYQSERRLFAVLYPKHGDRIRSRDRNTIFTDGSSKSFVDLIGQAKPSIQVVYQGDAYPVFESMPCLQLTTTEDISRYGLYINQNWERSLRGYATRNVENQWVVEIPDDGTSTLFDVVIKNMYTDAIIDQKVFSIAHGMCVQHQKNVCYGDERNFLVHYNGRDYPFCIGKLGEPIALENYLITPTLLRWRLDNGDWQTEKMQRPLWYQGPPLHNNVMLEIDKACLGQHSLRVMLGSKNLPLRKGHGQQYLLGDAITSDTDEKCQLNVIIDERMVYPLFTILRKPCFIAHPEFSIEDGIFFFDARQCFVGNINMVPKFRTSIKDEDENCFIETGLVDQVPAPTPLTDGWYNCCISIKENILSDQWTVIDSIEDYVVGDPLKEWFEGSALTLVSTKYVSAPGNKPEKMKLNALRLLSIEFLHVEMGLHCYKARLCGLQKRAMNVIFTWDGNGDDKPVIRMRSADDAQPLLLAADAINKILTSQEPDASKGLYRCASFYTKLD